MEFEETILYKSTLYPYRSLLETYFLLVLYSLQGTPGWLAGWLFDWLIGWLDGWLAGGWLAGWQLCGWQADLLGWLAGWAGCAGWLLEGRFI